jgi:hypothetical protein
MKIAMNPTKSNVTEKPVLCKDGTTQIQLSSPNAEYMPTCINNGGIAENQTVQSLVVTDPAKNMTSIHVGLFVGGVVVGYLLSKYMKK